MIENSNHHGEGASWSLKRPHDDFVELCAISTTGELTKEEQRTLSEHVAICSNCRQALREFEMAADVGASLLSSALTAERSHEPRRTAVLAPVSVPTTRFEGPVSERDLPESEARSVFHRSEVKWNYVWAPLAAVVALAVALGIYSYEAGRHEPSPIARVAPSTAANSVDTLEAQLSDAGHEREVLEAQLGDRDRMIEQLRREIGDESLALRKAKNAQADLESSLRDAVNEKQQLAQQQSSASQSLDAAEDSLKEMQDRLDLVEQERDQDELRAASLEAQIKDFNVQLIESQQTISKREDLLAEDRDIRDLMGARDLYIAEVYDVARNGATQKPYGRVFYTKGKSLVFYAYDLAQQPGVKDASAFQVWGQNGPDRQEALSLGIFYQDSVAKKRWVLKVDDAHTLEQINAVFVTIEPQGGSLKPSGKPLLFASLTTKPNHP